MMSYFFSLVDCHSIGFPLIIKFLLKLVATLLISDLIDIHLLIRILLKVWWKKCLNKVSYNLSLALMQALWYFIVRKIALEDYV